MDNYFWIGLVGAVAALLFAILQRQKVLAFSEGNDTMKKIASAIRQGANAYLRHQYTTVAKVFVVVFVILLALAYFGMLDNWFIPFAFLTGGIYSALAGFVGMRIATAANSRTAQAASESLNKGLNVAFSSGSVMGFTVVGLGLLDISVWFHILKYVAHFDAAKIAQTMVMFGMGASFMALFARVGGGIFTKAADVGADLVGKVEAGIPEDDPRNPATIADNVGDNCTSPMWAPSWPPSPWAWPPIPTTAGPPCCCPSPWPLWASCAPSPAPSSSAPKRALLSASCWAPCVRVLTAPPFWPPSWPLL